VAAPASLPARAPSIPAAPSLQTPAGDRATAPVGENSGQVLPRARRRHPKHQRIRTRRRPSTVPLHQQAARAQHRQRVPAVTRPHHHPGAAVPHKLRRETDETKIDWAGEGIQGQRRLGRGNTGARWRGQEHGGGGAAASRDGGGGGSADHDRSGRGGRWRRGGKREPAAARGAGGGSTVGAERQRAATAAAGAAPTTIVVGGGGDGDATGRGNQRRQGVPGAGARWGRSGSEPRRRRRGQRRPRT